MQGEIITKEVKTANELFEFLSPWKKEMNLHGCIFRGESCEEYELIPSALRKNKQEEIYTIVYPNQSKQSLKPLIDLDSEFGQISNEYILLREFYRLSNNHGLSLPISQTISKNLSRYFDFDGWKNEAFWINENMYEFSALAQHYGIPTRLLDWTYNLYVAMYFCFSGVLNSPDSKSENMVIWVLNKEKISLSGTCNPEKNKIAFITTHYALNPNISAQSGLFTHIPIDIKKIKSEKTIRTVDRTSLDSYLKQNYDFEEYNTEPMMRKIIIPRKEALNGMKILNSMGYGAAKIFPDYNGVVKQIMEMGVFNKTK